MANDVFDLDDGIIDEHPGLTLREYASRTGVSHPTIMARLGHLEGMGLIEQGVAEHGTYRPRKATQKGRLVLKDVAKWEAAS